MAIGLQYGISQIKAQKEDLFLSTTDTVHHFYEKDTIPGSCSPIENGTFYIRRIRRHRTYIAVYATHKNKAYKIVGEYKTTINKLKRHQFYDLQIKSVFPSGKYPSNELVTHIYLYDCLIGIEPKKGIFDVHSLVKIESE